MRRIRKVLFLVLAEVMRKTVLQLVVQAIVSGGIKAFKSLGMSQHDVGLQQILEKPQRTGAIRQGMEELQVNPVLVIKDTE